MFPGFRTANNQLKVIEPLAQYIASVRNCSRHPTDPNLVDRIPQLYQRLNQEMRTSAATNEDNSVTLFLSNFANLNSLTEALVTIRDKLKNFAANLLTSLDPDQKSWLIRRNDEIDNLSRDLNKTQQQGHYLKK